MNWAQLVLLLLLGLAGFQTLHYYPLLSPVIASHFGASGAANGWSTREGFFGLYWGVIALMTFCFYGLPVLLRRLPVSLINLPHREYWLAPERAAESLAALNAQMNWFGNAILAMMVITFQFAIQANLPGQSFPNTSMWALLGVFTVFLVGWLVSMFRRFPKPPAKQSTSG